MNELELINKAIEAQKLSYSPYSHFAVGAAILLKDGSYILGANIENASYGLSMCAERNAIFQAILKGIKKEDMVAIAITADANDLPYPCGACRQVLSELFPLDAPVIVATNNGKKLKSSLKELLPCIFTSESME
ncbi:MAG: cytidine deaminase [Bacillales bacterium]|nr:cytidine deaminase [Bacillales bacterium]